MKREFTPMMGEISGFGGGYEDQCRMMVLAGAQWLEDHPNADPKFSSIKGVFGIVNEENDDAKALVEAMVAPTRDAEGHSGVTGAMVHACTRHVWFIKCNNWDKYVEEMSKKDPEEKPN